MGNTESGPGDPLGPIGSLKHRLQSLEETIQSIEAAHQDAQGDHFPEPGAADVCVYGARLVCTSGVQVLTGPIIGEVTANSAPRLNIIAVSGDRPDRLAPGEPSLWRVLRERVEASTSVLGASGGRVGGGREYIDVLLHAGGQSWMADAFEDAWELLKRRAMEPVLGADGGWKEAQDEAAERLREAVRRAWNLPDKRVVLASVSNLMLCGVADVHPDFEGHLAKLSSMSRDGVTASKDSSGGGSENERHVIRALHAAVRVCRRVFCEYQGQLLWKAVSAEARGRGEDQQDIAAAFDAEEAGVEENLAETRRVERNVTVKKKKVAMAEEALRRAKAAGSLPAEGGLRAAEERIEKIRKEAKAARARRVALAKREIPAAAMAVAGRASQGGFLNLGGAIGFALLDTVWSRVSWDGRIDDRQLQHQDGEATPSTPPLLSPGAWRALELELSRDSELRLLVVVMRHALMGVVEGASSTELDQSEPSVFDDKDGNLKANQQSRPTPSDQALLPGTVDREGGGWRDEKDRLLDRLFAWKAGEAWREVVLVCGAAEARGGRGGIRSSCELEVLDSKHPGCTIRQIVAGPITDSPRRPAPVVGATAADPPAGLRGSRALSDFTPESGWRFSCRWSSDPASGDPAATGDGFEANDTVDSSVGAITTNPSGSLGTSVGTTPTSGRKANAGGDGGLTRHKGKEGAAAAPGWDAGGGGGAGSGRASEPPGGRADTQASRKSKQPATMAAAMVDTPTRRQEKPVSAGGERSFLEASLDGGHSAATAVAAGIDPAASARGVTASVAAEAVTVTFVGATVVLGPVVGRVTQRSAVVLVEVGSTAAVGCALTDGVTGRQHRQVRLLSPGHPYAFFFETLEEGRHYTIFLDGVENADARTGAFTTLKAWPDRREPPAVRAAARLSNAGQDSRDTPSAGGGGGDDAGDQTAACDVRLLFVSGTGLGATAGRSGQRHAPSGRGGSGLSVPGGGGGGGGGGEEDDSGDDTVGRGPGRGGTSTAVATADMWGVLGRELWRPWPQADVVVHTGSQVDLEVAVMEALPILSAAEAEYEDSEERQVAEEMAMERIRDAYRFQWSLPGARACLSCGSHLMLRGEADLALPLLHCSRSEKGGGLLGLQVSAYARHALARLASQAFADYQRQLWDPLSVPVGLDMNDVGYARGGAGIDSAGSGDGFPDATEGGGGEWHFHVFGETVGLFALDLRQGSAGLQRDERAPLLSDAQWSSLARALGIEEIQAMIIVGDAPFVSNSILDARAKARHPSNAHLRRSWPFHGGELLRLVGMLIEWKSAGAVGGDPREVTLVGGGLRYPLETVVDDSVTSATINQVVCGPFIGTPPLNGIAFELRGELSPRLSFRHTINDLRSRGGRGQKQPGDHKVLTHKESMANTNASKSDDDDPYRSASCVLVLCEARGTGPSAHLRVRSRLFTPASWAAWCDDSTASTTAGAAVAAVAAATPTTVDMGRPRGAPRWASTAGEEEGGNGRGGRGNKAAVDAADVHAALREEGGPLEILEEAFERLLDVEEDEDEDERLATARGGTGDATRRVFESLARAYDDDACARVRALCPVRPSPIVVRRLLKSAGQQRLSGPASSGINNSSPPTGEESKTRVAGDGVKTKTPQQTAAGKEGGKVARKKGRFGGAGGLEEGGGREGEGTALVPSWLFAHLPFHDDESFAVFFCDVLRGSERLACSDGSLDFSVGGVEGAMATSLDDLPLKIRHVKIVGNNRTRPYVVEDQLQDAYEAKTVGDVYGGLVEGAHKLEGTGLFESIQVSMDAVEDKGGSLDQTDVTITVKEKNWYLLQSGATTAGTKGNLDASELSNLRYSVAGALKNALGHGEMLDMGYNSPIAGQEGHTVSAKLFLPSLFRAPVTGTLEAIMDTVDLTKFCSLLEHRRGVTATARTLDGKHALAAEMGLRDLSPRRHPEVPYAYAASLGVVADAARPSTKTSLKYTYTEDERDDSFVPSVGSYLQASVEGAGLMGDTSFAKGMLELQHHIPLLGVAMGPEIVGPISLSLCASGGAIRPFGPSNRKTFFSDRFNLGGPMTLRGFPFYGAGPRAPKEEGGCKGGDALGGDIRYTASASLGFPFPVPAMATTGWRGYLFANLGNLTTWDTPLRHYGRDTRVSVGVAAAWNLLGVGRLEINYAKVLRRSQRDLHRERPLQFGFGVSFE
eukprot:g9338.t1